MSNEDPFAEPDDAEKTVIKPNPGGRRSVAPTITASAAPPHSEIRATAVPTSIQPHVSPSHVSNLFVLNVFLPFSKTVCF